MKAYMQSRTLNPTLLCVPDKDDEICVIKDFTQIGESLKAELCQGPGNKKIYLKITKERT